MEGGIPTHPCCRLLVFITSLYILVSLDQLTDVSVCFWRLGILCRNILGIIAAKKVCKEFLIRYSLLNLLKLFYVLYYFMYYLRIFYPHLVSQIMTLLFLRANFKHFH